MDDRAVCPVSPGVLWSRRLQRSVLPWRRGETRRPQLGRRLVLHRHLGDAPQKGVKLVVREIRTHATEPGRSVPHDLAHACGPAIAIPKLFDGATAGAVPDTRRHTMKSRRCARVALVVSSLDAGGAERVISIMANHWAERGWDVSLITIESAARDFYAIDPRVTRTSLDAGGCSDGIRDAVANNVHRINRLRAAIRNADPDGVISFLTSTNVLALIAGGFAHVPVIVSERIDPTEEAAPAVWKGLRRIAYPRADAVVVQTPEVRAWAEAFVPPERVHTIPNPVRLPPETFRDDQGAEALGGSRRVVTIGRLHRQKGFDTLIRAFARCHAAQPEWSLTIVGEGDERSRLEALEADLGVDAVVEMPGRVQNPFSVLRRADLFVLSSRYEGFPNALLEAMAVGTAVIATDCHSGPRHIVRHGVDGCLVPPDDVDSMADSMATLMRDDHRRRALSARAVEVRERFSVDRVMAEWERLVMQATRRVPEGGPPTDLIPAASTVTTRQQDTA